MPIALAVNIVNGALTLFVLQRLGASTLPLAWFCILTIVTVARWILWWRHRRVKPDAKGVYYWSLLAVGGSLLAGLCWGIGGEVLFPAVREPANGGALFLRRHCNVQHYWNDDPRLCCGALAGRTTAQQLFQRNA